MTVEFIAGASIDMFSSQAKSLHVGYKANGASLAGYNTAEESGPITTHHTTDQKP